jgi:hypothetical protein
MARYKSNFSSYEEIDNAAERTDAAERARNARKAGAALGLLAALITTAAIAVSFTDEGRGATIQPCEAAPNHVLAAGDNIDTTVETLAIAARHKRILDPTAHHVLFDWGSSDFATLPGELLCSLPDGSIGLLPEAEAAKL